MPLVSDHKKLERSRGTPTNDFYSSSGTPPDISQALMHLAPIRVGDVSRNLEMISGSQSNPHDGEDRSFQTGNDADRVRRLEAEFSEVGPDVRRRNYFVKFGNERFKGDQPGTTNAFSTTCDESLAAAMGKTGASPQNLATETDCTAYEDAKVSSVGSVAAKITQETEQTSLEIRELNENDVLLGRGRTYIDHPGNRHLQLLVDTHRGAYDSASRIDKTDITKSIVKVIQSKGGRFLKSEKGQQGWFEVSDERARCKVSHAMRDSRKKPPGVVEDIPVDNMLAVGGIRGLTETIGLAFPPLVSLHQHLLPNSNGLFEAENLQRHLFSLTNSDNAQSRSEDFFSPYGKVPSNRTR